MQASEFYALDEAYIQANFGYPPGPTRYDLNPFFVYTTDFIFQELGLPMVPNPNSQAGFGSQTRVEMRVVKSKWFRRGARTQALIWSIASIWFDGQPIAIVRNVGTNSMEGSYYPTRFITDRPAWNQMIRFLHSLLVIEIEESGDRVYDWWTERQGGELLPEPNYVAYGDDLTKLEEAIDASLIDQES